jgi:hypothetical protein
LQLTVFGSVAPQDIATDVVSLSLQSGNSDLHHDIIVLDNLRIHQKPPSAIMAVVRELTSHSITLSDHVNDRTDESEVHILFGTDLLNKVVLHDRLTLSLGAMAIHTKFGWALQGLITPHPSNSPIVITAMYSSSVSLDDKFSAFMELEAVPSTLSKNDIDLQNFSNKITYDGFRYEVGLL